MNRRMHACVLIAFCVHLNNQLVLIVCIKRRVCVNCNIVYQEYFRKYSRVFAAYHKIGSGEWLYSIDV